MAVLDSDRKNQMVWVSSGDRKNLVTILWWGYVGCFRTIFAERFSKTFGMPFLGDLKNFGHHLRNCDNWMVTIF